MLRRVQELEHAYLRLTRSLDCTVHAQDYETIKPRLATLADLAKMENRSLSLYDIASKSFLLKTDRHMQLLGYDGQEIAISNYHRMIHPADLPFLYDSELQMYYYLQKRDDKQDYKLVYDYRVRAKNGTYIRFLHQMAIFACDRENHAWLMLVISDVLQQHPQDSPPRRVLLNMRTQKACLFSEEQELVTLREQEILGLISQGLDSNQIADRLCISIHTVNNHRQNILAKTQARHITQAMYYLRCIGLL